MSKPWSVWSINGRAKRSRTKSRTMQRPRMCDIELRGLDGGNLLAYLAALETLRVLTAIKGDAEVRMSWVDRGCWIPVIHHSGTPTTEERLDVQEQSVCVRARIQESWA